MKRTIYYYYYYCDHSLVLTCLPSLTTTTTATMTTPPEPHLVSAVGLLQFGEELCRAGLCDGAQVVDQVVAGHADARVGDVEDVVILWEVLGKVSEYPSLASCRK